MLHEVPANIYGDPTLIYGKRVVVNSAVTPKIQLSEDCPVSDDYRVEINQWMIEHFGMKYIIPDDQVLLIDNDYFLMNPNAYEVFRHKLSPWIEVNHGR